MAPTAIVRAGRDLPWKASEYYTTTEVNLCLNDGQIDKVCEYPVSPCPYVAVASFILFVFLFSPSKLGIQVLYAFIIFTHLSFEAKKELMSN